MTTKLEELRAALRPDDVGEYQWWPKKRPGEGYGYSPDVVDVTAEVLALLAEAERIDREAEEACSARIEEASSQHQHAEEMSEAYTKRIGELTGRIVDLEIDVVKYRDLARDLEAENARLRSDLDDAADNRRVERELAEMRADDD